MNIEAPERYLNSGPGTFRTVLVSLATSAVTSAANTYWKLDLPIWFVLLPLLISYIVLSVYRPLVNAIHEAMRQAAYDSTIDDMETEALVATQNTIDSELLTPSVFADAVRGA
ncbi:hypothetical protein LAV_00058 [Sphingobium phage Lacusarx]|uniref:Uncharacterized protein n=1 Tax=Sphingobium phage Lacusarx TaxID=1980139 RepID=A0A1W6DX15_9CAUD|nr:hypothetical protein FDH44_gp058 [Sphingobium phage Lacusarx]ARK07458.1 hypothetical protein LAV_00058 [Sphingobium phage Lacusarx]